MTRGTKGRVGHTGQPCQFPGKWESYCHHALVSMLEGEEFPRCAECDNGCTWVLMEPAQGEEPGSSSL